MGGGPISFWAGFVLGWFRIGKVFVMSEVSLASVGLSHPTSDADGTTSL
jgi:hypothetical protein